MSQLFFSLPVPTRCLTCRAFYVTVALPKRSPSDSFNWTSNAAVTGHFLRVLHILTIAFTRSSTPTGGTFCFIAWTVDRSRLDRKTWGSGVRDSFTSRSRSRLRFYLHSVRCTVRVSAPGNLVNRCARRLPWLQEPCVGFLCGQLFGEMNLLFFLYGCYYDWIFNFCNFFGVLFERQWLFLLTNVTTGLHSPFNYFCCVFSMLYCLYKNKLQGKIWFNIIIYRTKWMEITF